MPLGSTDVTPLHRYYGLMPPDFEGHFLPSSFVGFYFPPLSGFRCSLRSSLSCAALASIFDPPAIPLSMVGWAWDSNRSFRLGQPLDPKIFWPRPDPFTTGERLSAPPNSRAVQTMISGGWAWPFYGPPTYLTPLGLLPLGAFQPPSPSFIPLDNSIRAHVGVSGRDCQPSIRAGTSPANSSAEFGLYLKRKPPGFYCIFLCRLSRNSAHFGFLRRGEKNAVF